MNSASEPDKGAIQAPASTSEPGQGFFAVDPISAECAFQRGMNAGIAYLVLARFSQRDNVITGAGAQAVRKYGGMSQYRSQRAILDLEHTGLLSPVGQAYRRSLTMLSEVAHQGKITDRQAEVIRRVANGTDPIHRSRDPDYAIAMSLVAKGAMFRSAVGRFCLPERILTWLPNCFVDGLDNEYESPLMRLRHLSDPCLGILLVNVYRHTDLAENCGIHWNKYRQKWTRHTVGQQGKFTVYGFTKGQQTVWPIMGKPFLTGERGDDDRDLGADDFFDAWELLDDTGFIETVPHIVESDGAEAMPLFPYGAYGRGTEIEQGLAENLHAIARQMVTDGQYKHACKSVGKDVRLCALPSHYRQVQMIGIARPVFRAHTQNTAAWVANFQKPQPDISAMIMDQQRAHMHSA